MKEFQLNKYMVEPEGKIAKRMVYQDKNVICFVLNIAKGEELPPHTHFECTVLVQVLKGSSKLVVDGQTTSISQGDIVQLDGPEKMSVRNDGDETLSLYVSISPAPPSEKYAMNVDI